MVQTLDPSTGGVARAVVSLSRAMQRHGHEVEIVALDEPKSAWLAQIDLPVHPLGAGVTSYRYSKELLPWLREEEKRFDHVVVNGIWQYMSFAAWRAFAGSTIPYYVVPHGMLDPWFKRTFPLKHLKKWLYWPWAEYRVLRDAAAVIFTSEEERLQARESFWLYRSRERVSALGAEAPESAPSDAREMFLEKYPVLKGTRILLFLGRLHPKKGCDLLIEAMRQFRSPNDSVSLVLAGPDQVGWERELLTRITDTSPPIVFTGMLEGAMKRRAFAAADAFILPSHQENFGISVVEALATGVPVLISNKINIWREIEADEAGYVENDDLVGTTKLIERWMQTPVDRRQAMRKNARQCFANRFEINRAAESLLNILAEPVAVA